MIQIRAADVSGAAKLADTLGTGDALLNKINTELEVRRQTLAHGVICVTCTYACLLEHCRDI